MGLGAEVVSGFADAHKSAIAAGFPDTIDTYGLVSGLWTSVFALGAFIGPTLAGILFDAVGFPLATLVVIVSQVIVLVAIVGFFFAYLCSRRSSDGAAVAGKEDEDEGIEDVSAPLLEVPGPEDGDYGAAETSAEQRRRRARSRGRQRKYSTVVAGSMAGSVAQSMSMAYPQFLNVATSYR